MFYQDDDNEALALYDTSQSGWTAPLHIVSQHVEAVLAVAVHIANRELDQPSEAAVIQIFRTMMDRTAFERGVHDVAYTH